MKTRIVLTVGCVGKSTADKNYNNVYDFDKHTLDYKWDRTGYEHLTDEQFKGLPTRVEKKGWFENYLTDFCKLVDSGKYSVVTSYLLKDLLDALLVRNYQVEIILLDLKSPDAIEEMKQRSVNRGNNSEYTSSMLKSYTHNMNRYKDYYNKPNLKIWVFDKPIYLSEFLLRTGTILERKTTEIGV